MKILDILKQFIGNESTTIKEPIFIKSSSDSYEYVKHLESSLKNKNATGSKKTQIEKDIKNWKFGIRGEENVAYELEHSFLPILILRDLHLTYNGFTSQIDYIVISSKFILVIECKNLWGNIKITETGDVIRFKSGKEINQEGMYNPIQQNRIHTSLVKQILKNELAIMKGKKATLLKSIVVMANPKTIITNEYKNEDDIPSIIKHDQLVRYMERLLNEKKHRTLFLEKEIKQIFETLLKFHNTNRKNIGSISISIQESPIYQELKQYRDQKRQEEDIKAFCVYNNNQIENLIIIMPSTINELMKISGFGKVRCKKYGEDILSILNRYR